MDEGMKKRPTAELKVRSASFTDDSVAVVVSQLFPSTAATFALSLQLLWIILLHWSGFSIGGCCSGSRYFLLML